MNDFLSEFKKTLNQDLNKNFVEVINIITKVSESLQEKYEGKDVKIYLELTSFRGNQAIYSVFAKRKSRSFELFNFELNISCCFPSSLEINGTSFISSDLDNFQKNIILALGKYIIPKVDAILILD